MAAQIPSSSVILIVDPGADEREMYCAYLSSYGVAAAQARDGASAVEQVECLSPAVVTTELRMPGVDGLALCKLVKARHAGVRVIAVTADGFGARGTATSGRWLRCCAGEAVSSSLIAQGNPAPTKSPRNASRAALSLTGSAPFTRSSDRLREPRVSGTVGDTALLEGN